MESITALAFCVFGAGEECPVTSISKCGPTGKVKSPNGQSSVSIVELLGSESSVVLVDGSLRIDGLTILGYERVTKTDINK